MTISGGIEQVKPIPLCPPPANATTLKNKPPPTSLTLVASFTTWMTYTP